MCSENCMNFNFCVQIFSYIHKNFELVKLVQNFGGPY